MAWSAPYSHERLLSGVNQDMSAQMVVSDEGLATALIVANKWPLAERNRGGKSFYTFLIVSVEGGACTTEYMLRSGDYFPE